MFLTRRVGSERFTVSWARHMSGDAHLLSSRRLTFPNSFESGTHSLMGEQREFFSHKMKCNSYLIIRFRSPNLLHRSQVI